MQLIILFLIFFLTLINVEGGRNHPPPLENHVFSAPEHPLDLRPVCKISGAELKS